MCYVGIDVGGPNVRFAFINSLEINVLEYKKKPFTQIGIAYREVEENICKIVDLAPTTVKGIGISLAAVMNRDTGRIKMWPNNSCWNNFNLMQHLSDKYNIPIIIEDDANCGAVGEYFYLNNSIKNMAYISIGTGIGCGLILNGSLYIGENGFAGEVGHLWMGGKKRENRCNCGNYDCFQTIASGPATIAKYNLITKYKVNSIQELYLRYMQSDLIAIQCVDNLIQSISQIVYNLAMTLDISMFIIGGGVSNIGKDFILQVEMDVNKRLSCFGREISIKKTQLKEYSGVYGVLRILNEHIKKG